MIDYSFLERIKILFNLITSSTFFLSLITLFLLTTFALLLYKRLNNKIIKYFVAFGYLLLATLILLKYGKSIVSLSDALVEQLFSFFYFPNIIAYICMIIITTILLIITIINKKITSFIKTCNIISFSIIEILFALTLDVVISKNIDIYSKTSVYSDDTMAVLIQASMFVFAIWVFVLIINYIVNFIDKKISKENFHTMEEQVFDEVKVVEPKTIINDTQFDDSNDFTLMSDEEFETSVKKKNIYKDIFGK